jgi:hypothetical protein
MLEPEGALILAQACAKAGCRVFMALDVLFGE